MHVLSSFGMGGQERVALDLAIGERALGCSVSALSLAPGPDGPVAAQFHDEGIATHTVPKRHGVDATLFPRLARLFWQERINIVHTHNPQPLLYGAVAARLARACAIHTKHGTNPDGGRRLIMRRAAARCTDAYVAVSETTAEIARRNREVPERKLHTIPNGIDLSRFHPDAVVRAEVRRELGIGAEVWLVLTVGRLAPEKDQALLIRALAPHLSESLQLAIAGDGVEAAPLRAQAAALGERARFVHLLGARRDTPRLYAASDVFALSSRTEGLPLVLPEAMASGLPVVSTAVGGIPAVVEEGAGYLVPSGDGAALAARLTELAADRARAARLGAHARELALAKYSAERMVKEYVALYEAALDRRRR